MNIPVIALNILIFIIGSCIFSFLNVVVYRVPKHMDFVRGRSLCPSCGHQLRGIDMVPVVSFFFLGRKCRYCKAPISSRYAIVELAGGFIALLSIFHYECTLKAVLVFAFISLLTVVALVDLDTMEIPNGFIIAGAVLAVCSMFCFIEMPLLERAVGAICVSLPMLLVTLVIPGAFGGGDIKLMAVCGVFLGWKLTLLSFFFAVITGGSYGAFVLASKKLGRKDHFAFGPFLALGMMIALFWGGAVWRWYMKLWF